MNVIAENRKNETDRDDDGDKSLSFALLPNLPAYGKGRKQRQERDQKGREIIQIPDVPGNDLRLLEGKVFCSAQNRPERDESGDAYQILPGIRIDDVIGKKQKQGK